MREDIWNPLWLHYILQYFHLVFLMCEPLTDEVVESDAPCLEKRKKEKKAISLHTISSHLNWNYSLYSQTQWHLAAASWWGAVINELVLVGSVEIRTVCLSFACSMWNKMLDFICLWRKQSCSPGYLSVLGLLKPGFWSYRERECSVFVPLPGSLQSSATKSCCPWNAEALHLFKIWPCAQGCLYWNKT